MEVEAERRLVAARVEAAEGAARNLASREGTQSQADHHPWLLHYTPNPSRETRNKRSKVKLRFLPHHTAQLLDSREALPRHEKLKRKKKNEKKNKKVTTEQIRARAVTTI